MKAVNLIPQDSRRGGAAVSRSGGGAYLVLGLLAALVIMAAAYAYEGKQIKTKKAETAQVDAEAASTEAQAAQLAAFTSFAALKQKRIDTVKSIANSRFDWSATMHDLAKVIPPNTWLTDLTGTVSPSASTGGGGGGAASSLRGAIDAPAITISGCTTSHPAVAKMMARMRLLDGVQRVTLTGSEKAEMGGGATGDSAAGGGDCRAGSDQYPKFDLIVFFKPIAGQGTPAAAPAATSPATPTTSGAAQ